MEKELTYEQAAEIIKKIIEEKTYLTYNEEEKVYEGDICVYSSDKLSKEQVQNILENNDPEGAFYDSLMNYVVDCEVIEVNQLIREIANSWNESEKYYDYVSKFIQDNVIFNFPYDHYLKSTVSMDIIIDTGDGNYDFTCNNLFEEDEGIQEESSLLWLVRQQGHTKEELIKAMCEDDRGSLNPFIKSVIEEAENVTTSMNALVFLVKMTLREAIAYRENIGNIIVDKNTVCGLYDAWNGAGSMLDIALEKDVKIPEKYVSIGYDGERGYSIHDIYGVSDDLWEYGGVKNK